MITVCGEKCAGCGICTEVCHNRCMALVDGCATIHHEICDCCTQCIAVCPQQALAWEQVQPISYERSLLPSPRQLDELFKERRSIRFFKVDRVDRSLIEEIVGYGIYAPTNNHKLRVVVVDDVVITAELERIAVRSNSRFYRIFFKPKIVYGLLSRITPAVNPQVKIKLEKRMHDTFRPAAMVFVVGDRRIAFSEASAQAALDLMALYAHVRGVGSCLWGAGRIIFNRSKTIKQRLGLHKREHILGILLLGYPAVRFRNKVEGRTMSIQWNGKPKQSHGSNEIQTSESLRRHNDHES